MREDVLITIDRAVKELWLYDIFYDCVNRYLPNEDTLKNSFYFHLRRRLGERFLEYNNLRIFTEFNSGELKGTGFRADIAIVKTDPAFNGYINACPDNKIVALFELKHSTPERAFDSDIEKTKYYIRDLKIRDCLFYLGFISDKTYSKKPRLEARRTNIWANGKVTVLSLHNVENVEEGFMSHIQSRNRLNADLDD
ncbi:MAG: hypothetical protein LBN00_09305 [Oscillospiraceae bacterium]|jgi:hypothetical protein|nr:hypothetical protein [Oscillospiraceae bacterium]